jgi:phenylpropionate dioxygenase-like ring-hydroxylating dioxygenase large terminal subunit
MIEADRLVDLERGKVHADALASSDVYDAERVGIFDRSWLFLAHESDVLGDVPVMTWMGDEAVVVDRAADGRLRARAAGEALVPVPRVESLAGLVFGCWDAEVADLGSVLGDASRALRANLTGRETPGDVHAWVIDANWKACATRSADGGSITPSTVRIALHDTVQPYWDDLDDPTTRRRPTDEPAADDDIRVFPTFSYLPALQTIRVWHPRGAGRTEVQAWVIAEPDTPDHVRRALEVFADDVLAADASALATAEIDCAGPVARAFYERWCAALS